MTFAVMATPASAAGPKAFGKSTSNFIDDFASNTYVPILSRTFRVPAKGVLLISASVNIEDDESLLGNGRTSLNLKVDTKQVWADEQGFEVSTSDVEFA